MGKILITKTVEYDSLKDYLKSEEVTTKEKIDYVWKEISMGNFNIRAEFDDFCKFLSDPSYFFPKKRVEVREPRIRDSNTN